tara:strand:- start:904 stop:1113 length:210 start_codon:yes stop_codon:yes gene_type:complete
MAGWTLVLAATMAAQGAEIASYATEAECFDAGVKVIGVAQEWAPEAKADRSIVFRCLEQKAPLKATELP